MTTTMIVNYCIINKYQHLLIIDEWSSVRFIIIRIEIIAVQYKEMAGSIV